MEKATLYARTVEQPNRNQEYPDFLCGIMAYDKWGRSEGYYCANCSDPRYYHEWSWVENLREPNKPTQCGRPNGKMCNHETYYGIAGYRNTCPIAGCSGTYARPALIKLSNFDFKSLGINANSTIYSISVSWEHRCRGVDVAVDGTVYNETTNSPPNFDGFGHYDRTVVESYLQCGDRKIADLHGFNGVIVSNPPNSDSFEGVPVAIARNLKAEDIIDPNFALYIQYGQNLSTNPGNLYINNVTITIEYQNGEPVIISPENKKELYTSTDTTCNCYSTITHKVIGNWLFVNGIVGQIMKQRPLTVMLDANNCPENVSVIDTTPNNSYSKIYKIEDHSGIAGDKCISYYLKEYPEKRVDVWYTAKKYKRPEIKIVKNYIKDVKKNGQWQIYDNDKAYISARGGCSDYIYVWFDTIDKSPDLTFGCLNPTVDELLMYDASGNKTNTYQLQFYNYIQGLECGTHHVFVKNGKSNDEIKSFLINISSPEFSFTIQDSTTGDWQQDRGANRMKGILITRTDSVPIETATINVHDKTQNNPLNPNPKPIKQYNIKSKQTITHQMSKYYAGTFPIIVEPTIARCKTKSIQENFTVIPYHKQYYDSLFVRGEDSTSFDYDYLVAWRGDDVRVPIKAKSVELGATVEDIQICTENSHIGIGETGLVPIKITNIGGRGTIENLQIELNLVDIAEDGDLTVTTDDWELEEGLFYKERLMTDFYTHNAAIKNNVSIKIDRDSQNASDAENVYIYIRQLQEDSTIEVNIPFQSLSPRTIYMQFLIFEQVQDIYSSNCKNRVAQIKGNDNLIKIEVLDSIATNINISGEDGYNDILYPNMVSCPLECYATNITYTITNIDTSSLSGIHIAGLDEAESAYIRPLTQIRNSLEMVPYQYTYNNQTHPISDNDWIDGVYQADENLTFYRKPLDRRVKLSRQLLKAHIRFPNLPEQIIPIRTEENGSAILPIGIPVYMQGKYSIGKILSNYVFLEYAGDSIYSHSYLSVNNEDYQQKANVQPAVTSIEYIGVKTYYADNQQIPKNAKVTLKYRIASNQQMLNQKSIQIFLKGTNYELNQIVVSTDKHNEFVHKKSISTYQSATRTSILNKYTNAPYKTDLTGKCTKVIDGDTIEVNTVGRVRLVGINTPEQGMLGYDVSKYFVEKLCLNQTVKVKIDSQTPKDKYGRSLAIITVDNKNLNEMLLKEGLAEIMYMPPSEFNPYSWGRNNPSYGANIQFTITNPKAQTLSQLIKSIELVFNGDSLYKAYNPKRIPIDDGKIKTTIDYLDTWRSYKAGQVANVKVTLYALENYLDNYIDFRPFIDESGSSDELTVSYKMCNLKDNRGDFLTTFKTNDDRLIRNEKSEIIYCGMDTSATIKYRLNMEVIQQTFINILNISITNGYKKNKQVSINIDLSQELERFKGDYEFISIETEDGDYALKDNKEIIWYIGDMDSNMRTNATIKIKANEIGLSKIKIQAHDYLHNTKAAEDYVKDIGHKECEDCIK